MERATRAKILAAACAGLALAVPAQEPTAGRVSRGALAVSGVSETRFNPRRGTLLVEVRGAVLSTDPQDVQVLVDERPLPPGALRISARVITVDYEFADGLNEMVVSARDRDGALLGAEMLLWAGDGTLVVDVIDAHLAPVDGATVTVLLGENAVVRSTARTANGTVMFENLPDEPLAVEVQSPAGTRASAAVSAPGGSLLVELGTAAQAE